MEKVLGVNIRSWLPGKHTTSESVEISADVNPGSYEQGSLFNHIEFFDLIRQLAASSSVIRLLRKKIFRALLARFRQEPSFKKMLSTLRRSFCLYLVH